MSELSQRLEGIRRQLFVYADECVERLANGTTLICPLGYGAQAYLHKLFSGATKSELEQINQALGFPSPKDYECFMLFSNGATLFDNTLFLFGTRPNWSRSLAVEDIAPLSLLENIGTFQRLHPGSVWSPVGSISAARVSYSIQLRSDGNTRVASDTDDARTFPTFFAFLEVILSLFNTLADCGGLRDETGERLEKEVDALLREPA